MPKKPQQTLTLDLHLPVPILTFLHLPINKASLQLLHFLASLPSGLDLQPKDKSYKIVLYIFANLTTAITTFLSQYEISHHLV
jgi:hypothetical protein